MNKSITFYQKFEQDIVKGLKTITIRDEAESHFSPGDLVEVLSYEDDRWFCQIEIVSVFPIRLDALTEEHAKQENMSLPTLKDLIREIYPATDSFFVIEFRIRNIDK